MKERNSKGLFQTTISQTQASKKTDQHKHFSVDFLLPTFAVSGNTFLGWFCSMFSTEDVLSQKPLRVQMVFKLVWSVQIDIIYHGTTFFVFFTQK